MFDHQMSKLGMRPDPTRAFFWPAVNKRPTQLWLGYFLTQPNEIFFDPKGKNWGFLGENFQTHNTYQRRLTQTEHVPRPITNPNMVASTCDKICYGIRSKRYFLGGCQSRVFLVTKVWTLTLWKSSTLEKFELYQGSLIWTLKSTNNVRDRTTNKISYSRNIQKVLVCI